MLSDLIVMQNKIIWKKNGIAKYFFRETTTIELQ